MSTADSLPTHASHSTVSQRDLPSGRSVVVRVDGVQEQIELRSAEGAVEVRIVMTDDGPVVSLTGGRLEVNTPDTVAFNCKNFEVNASEKAHIASGGPVRVTGQELRVLTDNDVHLNGAFIRLNCPDSLESDPERSADADDQAAGE